MPKLKPTASTPLSSREELFVHAYIASGNATDAAKKAGYSERGASERGSELLKRAHVSAAIDAARTRIVKKYNATAERTIEEMAVIAFSDIRHYALDGAGFLVLADGAPDEAMRAVKKFKRKVRTFTSEHGTETIIESEYEMWSKDSQLRNLGEWHKLFKENRAGDEDTELTPAQRRDRVIDLLKVAARRKKMAVVQGGSAGATRTA